MPIVTHQRLNLEEHVFPLLQQLGLCPVWHDPDDGFHEGIHTAQGYVSQCNGNDLYVTGKREFADVLAARCRPFGSELVVHFSPEEPKIVQRSVLSRVLSLLR